MDKVRDQMIRDTRDIENTDGGRRATTGQELPETYLRPIGGGRRGGSYIDMTFNMDGKQTVYVQTVDRGKINGMS